MMFDQSKYRRQELFLENKNIKGRMTRACAPAVWRGPQGAPAPGPQLRREAAALALAGGRFRTRPGRRCSVRCCQRGLGQGALRRALQRFCPSTAQRQGCAWGLTGARVLHHRETVDLWF